VQVNIFVTFVLSILRSNTEIKWTLKFRNVKSNVDKANELKIASIYEHLLCIYHIVKCFRLNCRSK